MITSEEDAWEIIKRIDAGEFGDELLIPKFAGWPKFEIKFWRDNEQRVLTTPMMEGLLSYQSSINRAFLYIEKDTTNLRNLSKEDRIAQEVKFKIKAGSTKAEPELLDVIKEFAKSAGANMTGQQVAVTIIVVALIWASVAAWRAWLDAKTQTAQNDTNSDNIKQILEATRVASSSDVEKMALMTKVVQQALGSQTLIETGDEGKQGLVRAASKVDDTSIAGIEIPPEAARRIVRHTRSNPTRDTMKGLFRVVRTDSDYADGFRVRIRNEETDEEFFAGLRDALISEADREIISKAEWSKDTFYAEIAVQRHRGEITSAEIVKVEASDLQATDGGTDN